MNTFALAATAASPAYWRTRGTRRAARLPLSPFTAVWYATWRAGKALP